MNKVVAVVLAGGRSSRMGFNKLTASLAGHPMVWYAVDNLVKAGAKRILIVVGHDREKVKRAIGDIDEAEIDWLIQEQQKGTGHAASFALQKLADEKHIIILFGDCPFLDDDIIQNVFERHIESDAGITIATSKMREPRYLGKVLRDESGNVTCIEEDYSSAFGPGEIFAGLSVWNTDVFSEYIQKLPIKNKNRKLLEQDLPDAVALYVKDGGKVETFSEISEDDALGLNYPIEFNRATSYLRVKVGARLISRGVIIPDPGTVRVDYDVPVGEGTELRANCHLIGKSTVGRGCQIGPDTTLKNCVVGNNSVIGKGHWDDLQFPANSKIADRIVQRTSVFHRPAYVIPEDPLMAFVAMPFCEPYESMVVNIISPLLKEVGMGCKVASESRNPGIVIDDIWEDINRAGLVLAEISEPNPNVWYELGLAHALNKTVIMLRKATSHTEKIPFDVSHLRVLIYNPEKGDLLTNLREWLRNHAATRDH
jgi:bifunctional N-acetylglucosamine-1-phosphate-uridyltransferase/glucosamine-1-phosphate-acetyltransferase GlmU-like protein